MRPVRSLKATRDAADMPGPSATLTGMAFKVKRNGPEPAMEFGDKDKFEIVAGGVLKIRLANGTNLYINPGMWASIEETPSPSAGPSPRVNPSRDDLEVAPEEGPF